MLSNIGSQVYILGGFDGYECLREVERIDLSIPTPTFQKLRNLSTPIKNGASYYHEKDGCIYLVGGWDEKETLDTIFKYDPKTQDTHFVSHLPHKIEGHSLNVIGESMFIFGGFDSFGVTDTIIQVDINTWESTVVKDTKMKYKRENLTS
jgi:hypothetical protein